MFLFTPGSNITTSCILADGGARRCGASRWRKSRPYPYGAENWCRGGRTNRVNLNYAAIFEARRAWRQVMVGYTARRIVSVEFGWQYLSRIVAIKGMDHASVFLLLLDRVNSMMDTLPLPRNRYGMPSASFDNHFCPMGGPSIVLMSLLGSN